MFLAIAEEQCFEEFRVGARATCKFFLLFLQEGKAKGRMGLKLSQVGTGVDGA